MTSASIFSDKVEDKRPSSPTTDPFAMDTPLAAEIQTLAERPFPDLSEGYALHGQMGAEDTVWIIARQSALEQIRTHSISNLRTELGGVLLGRAYRSGKRLLLVIKAALPAVSSDQGPSHFTFSADSWTQIHKDKAAQYPDLDIIGWFHTHPALGVFYSSDDVVVHSAAFTLPWHVGLVIDPIRNEACFFGWNNGELIPFTGFHEKLDPNPNPVIKWRVVRTSVRQMAFYDESLYAPEPKTAEMQSRGKRTPYWGVLVAAVSLLLTFFFLVGWVVSLNRQVTQMETVITTMAHEGLANSNAALCPDPHLRILAPLTGSRTTVGASVQLLGTAVIGDAAGYQLQSRLAGTNEWTTVDTRRWDTSLGQLGRWRTKDVQPGLYELRLTAVDNNNIRLSNSAPCMINLELLP